METGLAALVWVGVAFGLLVLGWTLLCMAVGIGKWLTERTDSDYPDITPNSLDDRLDDEFEVSLKEEHFDLLESVDEKLSQVLEGDRELTGIVDVLMGHINSMEDGQIELLDRIEKLGKKCDGCPIKQPDSEPVKYESFEGVLKDWPSTTLESKPLPADWMSDRDVLHIGFNPVVWSNEVTMDGTHVVKDTGKRWCPERKAFVLPEVTSDVKVESN